MDKKTILSEIDKTINSIRKTVKAESKSDLITFIDELEKLKTKIIDNDLKNNPLRGFPRRYAEMYSDYLNPITDILDKVEKVVDVYLEKEK